MELKDAFASFAVRDLNEARSFYEDVLGLKADVLDMGVMRLHVAGAGVLVYPKPDHTPATFTVLNFEVEDVEASVDLLVERGVVFERYEGFDMDDKNISRSDDGPAIAWFTDPSGNIFSVLQS